MMIHFRGTQFSKEVILVGLSLPSRISLNSGISQFGPQIVGEQVGPDLIEGLLQSVRFDF